MLHVRHLFRLADPCGNVGIHMIMERHYVWVIDLMF
jgi:hypothetical protein